MEYLDFLNTEKYKNKIINNTLASPLFEIVFDSTLDNFQTATDIDDRPRHEGPVSIPQIDLQNELLYAVSAEIVWYMDENMMLQIDNHKVQPATAVENIPNDTIMDRLEVFIDVLEEKVELIKSDSIGMIANPLMISLIQSSSSSNLKKADGGFKGPNNSMLIGTVNFTQKSADLYSILTRDGVDAVYILPKNKSKLIVNYDNLFASIDGKIAVNYKHEVDGSEIHKVILPNFSFA